MENLKWISLIWRKNWNKKINLKVVQLRLDHTTFRLKYGCSTEWANLTDVIRKKKVILCIATKIWTLYTVQILHIFKEKSSLLDFLNSLTKSSLKDCSSSTPCVANLVARCQHGATVNIVCNINIYLENRSLLDICVELG